MESRGWRSGHQPGSSAYSVIQGLTTPKRLQSFLKVCDFCYTLPLHVPEVSRPLCSQSCSQRSHTQQEIKSNSDSTVGGRRTASHKARGTNSSALPRAQPSQAGNAGTAWEVQKPPSSSLARQLPTSSKAGASFMGP